jgi:type II secretory pathway pseudopilin PulG
MKKGISLIILVVTIVITLILLSIVIFNLSNDNITNKASEVSFKASIKMYQEQLNSYISNKRMEYKLRGEQYDPSSDLDLTVETAIPGMKEEDKLNFYISSGKLYYSGDNNQWASDISTDYVQTEGVNKPKLISGMTAVKWNNTTRTWDTVLKSKFRYYMV